jgi:hypothetical protein
MKDLLLYSSKVGQNDKLPWLAVNPVWYSIHSTPFSSKKSFETEQTKLRHLSLNNVKVRCPLSLVSYEWGIVSVVYFKFFLATYQLVVNRFWCF